VTTKVSVCLLTYNHQHLVAEVLNSILAQTYRNFELIISDDCSSDGTWELIQGTAKEDPRVRVVRTPRNLGMAGNANFAIGVAAGEYVALLHHDDIVAPTLLEKWLEVVMGGESIAFVFNDYAIEGAASHASEGRGFTRYMSGQHFLQKHLLSGWGCPVRGTALINKQNFNAIGGMNERFSLLADVDLWMRLAFRWNVGYVGERLMRVMHSPPPGYSEDYRQFSWLRLRTLFDIHAANRESIESERSFFFLQLGWWVFRSRVSIESAKWLLYALVRGRVCMMSRACDGANDYEWWPVAMFRRAVGAIGKAVSTASPRLGQRHRPADAARERQSNP
jgi:glycosyltransferase involved in cell wall biosynthesis